MTKSKQKFYLGLKSPILIGVSLILLVSGLISFTAIYAQRGHGGRGGAVIYPTGSPGEAVLTPASDRINISAELVGVSNADGCIIFRGEQEIYRGAYQSIDHKYYCQTTDIGLLPETDYDYYFLLYTGSLQTASYGPYSSRTLAAATAVVEETLTAEEIKSAVSLSLLIDCPAVISFYKHNIGSFNLVNTALAASLATTSTAANYLIGFFLIIFLAALIFLIRNHSRRPAFSHWKLLPALAWKKPSQTFLHLVISDSEGSWSASYARHRFYHQLGAAGFWGVFTAVAVKLVILFLLSTAIISGPALIAQEAPAVANCQVNAGQNITYHLVLTNNSVKSLTADISLPLAKGLTLVNNVSQWQKTVAAGEKLALTFQVRPDL